MKVTPVLISYRNRWSWVVALFAGLIISSVITGLSVGLALGLACCTSNGYTKYDGLIGPQSNDLYIIIKSLGTKTLDVGKAVCNSDPACVYFDYTSVQDSGICFLYTSSELSTTTANSDYSVYVKNGYSLTNSG